MTEIKLPGDTMPKEYKPSGTNYVTPTRAKRHEFWATPEVNEILETQISMAKVDFINEAVAHYWQTLQADINPLVSDAVVDRLAAKVARAVKKHLEAE